MWPFQKRNIEVKIKATSVSLIDGVITIDVRGQTCPGYLLAINKEIEKLEKGTLVDLLISYAPCHGDVKAWCKEKGIAFEKIIENDGMWKITIKK